MKIEDEALKRSIKRKALKLGTKIGEFQYFVRYYKTLYFVDFKDDSVIEQSEYK